jgi:hypothetical protein
VIGYVSRSLRRNLVYDVGERTIHINVHFPHVLLLKYKLVPLNVRMPISYEHEHALINARTRKINSDNLAVASICIHVERKGRDATSRDETWGRLIAKVLVKVIL